MLKWVLGIVVFMFAIGMVFIISPTHISSEEITSKYQENIPAHTETHCNMSGKVMVCGSYSYSEEIKYYIKTKNFNLSVNKNLYDKVKEKDIIKIKYKNIIFKIVYYISV